MAERSSPQSSRSVHRILLLLVLACLFPGIIGATILFAYQYQAERTQQERNMIHTARALVQAVDNHLLRAQAIAETLATSDSLIQGNFEQFHKRAAKAVASTGIGTNVVLRDRAEQLILNTSKEYGSPLPTQPQRPHVRQVFATGKPAVSDLFNVPQFKLPIISIDVPVVINGQVTYSLGIGVLTDHFQAILKAQDLPSDWIAGIFDSRGHFVARTISLDEFIGKRPSDNLFQAMIAASEGTVRTTTGEGIATLTFYRRSAVTNWAVAIGIPRQSFTNALILPLTALAFGVAALFGIGLTLAWFKARRIARSFNALIAPSESLGAGYPAMIPHIGIKEADKVASALGRASELLTAKDEQLLEAHRLAKFGTWYWDPKTGEVQASDTLCEVYGRDVPSFPEMRGTILPEESWQCINAAAQESLRTGEGYNLEMQANHSSGQIIWIHAKCDVVRNDGGEVIALHGIVQDITERKRAEQLLRDSEEKLRNAALHDALTGLPNRALVMDYCERLLAAAQRGHAGGALLFIDLDRFKPINDRYGHETGDRVLQEVATRLVASTRQEDLVGRLGGDEFVIVLPHADGARHRAAAVAQHVVGSISQPIRIDEFEMSVSPSIGISYFPEQATTVSALIHAADLAMYLAKQLGRANYQFYSPELDRQAEQVLSVEARLRSALSSGGLQLHYQPVINLKNGKLIGAEALVRLIDGGEAIGPDRFIPIAESAGLIGQLGEWVIAEACRQHAAWLREGMRLTIAINVSPLQFRQRTFAERLGSIVADTGMDPSCLEIEVTESAVMENIDEAVGILNRIKSLGVKVALDDFGTGYSSLSSLTSLPLDKLKVDQSFVRRIERDPACRTVTEAIIGLGRSLRLNVHGEGIESEDAMLYLEAHGCNQAQGYWFSRPLPPAEFAHWYHEQWGTNSNASWERVRRIWAPRK